MAGAVRTAVGSFLMTIIMNMVSDDVHHENRRRPWCRRSGSHAEAEWCRRCRRTYISAGSGMAFGTARAGNPAAGRHVVAPTHALAHRQAYIRTPLTMAPQRIMKAPSAPSCIRMYPVPAGLLLSFGWDECCLCSAWEAKDLPSPIGTGAVMPDGKHSLTIKRHNMRAAHRRVQPTAGTSR